MPTDDKPREERCPRCGRDSLLWSPVLGKMCANCGPLSDTPAPPSDELVSEEERDELLEAKGLLRNALGCIAGDEFQTYERAKEWAREVLFPNDEPQTLGDA